MNKRIAQVVVGLPVEGPYDYSISPEFKEKIAIGSRVRINFGNTRRIGFVTGFLSKSKFKFVKPIAALLDNQPALSANILKLAKIFSEYYGCSFGEAIETTLPTPLRKGKDLEMQISAKTKTKKKNPETTLLHDKGSSERWELIKEQMDATLLDDRGVIFLVPEVSLIESTVHKLKDYFETPIAVLDKKLNAKEEIEQWQSLREGKVRIVVGTRSAIFAPVQNLGLIVIDEEDNTSYKQEQSPFYHVRDVALMRQKCEGCDCLWVSSTPSAESWYLAKKNKIKKITCEAKQLSDVQVVDLSNYNPRKTSIISFPLRNEIERILEAGGKVLLFMNRRGFSTLTKCNKCGFEMKCERCDVRLMYSYSKKMMNCRLCNNKVKLPKVCPKCKGNYMRSLGTGIEKLESDIARILPMARVARFDKESTKAPKDANVIIGTQAILRVLGELNIDMIAVLRFDSELNRMDFRSTQRAFSLLVQLGSYAKKKLIIQTNNIDNYSIKAIRKMNFDQFYQEEIKLRKELEFPPFKHMVAIGFRGKNEDIVLDQANNFYNELYQRDLKNVEVMDPHPDVLPKLRDKYRFTVMLKGRNVKQMLALTKESLKDFKRKRSTIITTNIDP